MQRAQFFDDPVYLGDEHFGEAKEYFKVIIDKISKQFHEKELQFADIGCASGAFIHFAMKSLKNLKACGFDPAVNLLEEAKRKISEADFYSYSLETDINPLSKKFDVCTCLGTLSLLDDLDVALLNLASFVSNRGTLIIYDIVNKDPVDLWMRYRTVEGEPSEWRAGFNLRSKQTYERAIFKAMPKAKVTWEPFILPFSLPKESPMRAWTMETEFNPRQLVVGTGQLLDFYIITVQK